ncbi:MAG: T9SS type A sorting domain-containing protein [Bacteroidales bacterium]|jgi:TRAP-type C4-dicarboxylate transport system substrate-binding protein|nr:T9SS type A sorting domain-containing protein [Bacteroidales bacterium]
MKPVILAFVLAIVSIAASAQTIEYGYDACGNRVTRQIVLEKTNKSLSVASVQEDFSEEQLGEVQVRIYPNPTHGHLKVVLQGVDELQGAIEVYDTQGKRIAYLPKAEHENDIDLSPQPNGIYLMRLTINGEVSTWKILKK